MKTRHRHNTGVWNQILDQESGATSIEYAMVASLIAVAIAGVLSLAGPSLQATFSAVTAALSGG